MADHWLDVMPQPVLVRGMLLLSRMDLWAVPLRDMTRGVVVESMGVLFVVWETGETVPADECGEVCPDLRAPAEFCRALQRLVRERHVDGDTEPEVDDLPDGLVWRHLCCRSTDDDRFAVARALAEVSRG